MKFKHISYDQLHLFFQNNIKEKIELLFPCFKVLNYETSQNSKKNDLKNSKKLKSFEFLITQSSILNYFSNVKLLLIFTKSIIVCVCLLLNVFLYIFTFPIFNTIFVVCETFGGSTTPHNSPSNTVRFVNKNFAIVWVNIISE